MRYWDGIKCMFCGYVQSRRGWWLLDGWCFRCHRTNPIPEQATDDAKALAGDGDAG